MTYEYLGYLKYLAEGAPRLEDVAVALEGEAGRLRAMAAAGLELSHVVDGGYLLVTTDDEELARRFGMQPREVDGEDDEDEEVV